MLSQVPIPQLSANVTEAMIVEWRCAEGDAVNQGDILVELSTEKANIDVESPAEGLVRRTLATEKSVLPIGYVVALVGAAEDDLPDVEEANAELLRKHAEAQVLELGGNRRRSERRKAVRTTPAARRLARELGVGLRELKQSAQVDVITEDVVREFHARGSNS